MAPRPREGGLSLWLSALLAHARPLLVPRHATSILVTAIPLGSEPPLPSAANRRVGSIGQTNSSAPHPRKAKSFLGCGAGELACSASQESKVVPGMRSSPHPLFFDVPKQKGRGGLKPDEVVAFLFRILLGVFRILLVVSCKPPALPSKHATSHLQSRESGGRKEADTEKPRT